ncbi:MAG: FkbM family methyltransferase [Acidimicrobiales bacterium]|nr:FkbM family methyltransferase [Acidimicrobiales bacterium]HRW37113.1 FkbM family methyltransferase [Aquihabitans sp.]
MNRYRVQRALLAPRRAVMRRRRPVDDAFLRAALELHSYSRAMHRFIAATAATPDLLTDVPRAPGGTVVDVGAYDGIWASGVLRHGDARVVCFEPDPSGLRLLRERLGDDPRVSICAFGLGGRDETATLALEGPGSTLYHDGSGTFGEVTVEVRDADRALRELGIDEVELLKLNIEGAEFDVLDRLLATGWIPRSRHLLIQFHEWHPKAHARRRALRRALAATHDEVWCYPWVWERWERRA